MPNALLFHSENLNLKSRSLQADSMSASSAMETSPGVNITATVSLLTSLSPSSFKPTTYFTTLYTTDNNTNVTQPSVITLGPPGNDLRPDEIAVAIVLVLVIAISLLVLLYCCLKKRGKLYKLPCYKPVTRTRRSSTSSSRRALEEHDVMEDSVRTRPDGQMDDMFTVDDFENPPDPQEGREEYYYDEVFGQSQFEDETTNKAMRQLYSDGRNSPEEEMLDLDFETLGIKIDDYIPESDRKNTA